MNQLWMRGFSLAVGLSSVAFTLAQTPPQVPGAPVPGAVAPVGRGTAVPVTGSGRVRGRVVSDTGVPLARVQVRLRPPAPGQQLGTATDEQGRYEFTDLPAAQYSASAALGGYVTMQYGQRSPNEPARQIRIADGETADRIDFTLPRGGAIVAQVSDEFGDPLAGFRVTVERFSFVNGQRRLSLAPAAALGPLSETDDRGQVRLFGFPPGEYYVSASLGILATVNSPTGSNTRSYLQTYHPDAYSPDQAQPVSLGPRQEITVPVKMTAIKVPSVSGVLRKPNGEPAGQINLSLALTSGASSRGVVTRPDGTFIFTNTAPGNYVLTMASAPAGSTNAGLTDVLRMPVVVGGDDVTGITAVLSKGGTAQGKVSFDGGVVAAGLRPGALLLMANEPGAGATSAASRATIGDDWGFTASSLIGTRVFRLRQPPDGLFLKAVMLDGRDVTDTALDFTGAREITDLEVILTQRAASVTGSVTDAQGAAATRYAVVVFAADREQWTSYSRFIGAGRPDQKGAFRVAGLPAGRYLAAAVDYLDSGEERDPELLERLSRTATAFMLAEGEARSLTLRIQGR